jgi:uncharacterized Ntn-hydrolase superfamily protein
VRALTARSVVRPKAGNKLRTVVRPKAGNKLRTVALFVGATLCLPAEARATYSIAAVDLARAEFGAAATSCLGGGDVAVVYRAVPMVGVMLAQAHYDGDAHQRGIELLAQGQTPSEVIEAITTGGDGRSAFRQYALVDLTGRVAAFTGANADPVALDQRGESSTLRFSVQGNTLSSEAVVRSAARAASGPACDLAERLLRALEAGALDGNGDSRCTGAGIPADSAFLQVEAANGETVVSLSVPSSGSANPLLGLRAQFQAFRAEHPCSLPEEAPAKAKSASGSGCSLTGKAGHAPWVSVLLALALTQRRRAPSRPGEQGDFR